MHSPILIIFSLSERAQQLVIILTLIFAPCLSAQIPSDNGSLYPLGHAWLDFTENSESLTTNPTIATSQSLTQTIANGNAATLTVSATGTSLSYQWQRNGVNINGATGASFAVNNIQVVDVGTYTVVVTDSVGNSVSLTFNLNVTVPTVLSRMPVWWSASTTTIFDSQSEDNKAVANVGQLKQVATQAKKHMESILGSISWDDVYGAGNSPFPFDTAANPDNFSPATVGQLKFLASGFYKLLYSRVPSYDVRARLISLGASQGDLSGTGPYYPWSSDSLENNAPITIGQLKLVFSFDLSPP